MVWLATVVACGQVRNPQLMGALCGSILAAIEDLGPQNVGVLINLSGKDCAPKETPTRKYAQHVSFMICKRG